MDGNYDVYVTRVIDGETFVGGVHDHDLENQYFKLKGIKVKEFHGKEGMMGLEADDFLERWILNKSIKVKVSGKENGGYLLSIIFIGGINVNEELIRNGFAEKVDYQ